MRDNREEPTFQSARDRDPGWRRVDLPGVGTGHNAKSQTALARNRGKLFVCQDCGFFVLLSAASRERGDSSGRMTVGMGCGSPICAERCQRFRFAERQSKHVEEVTRGSCDVVAPPKTRRDPKRETLGELEAMHVALRIVKTILLCM